MKRTPMKRTGFKRPQRLISVERAETASAPAATVGPIRRGVIAPVVGFTPAIPKNARHTNDYLLSMARGRDCLMRVKGVCNFDTATTVAAHSNWCRHGGKGGARKANDEFTVWACSSCHDWLDKSPADAVLKEMTFMQAHLEQVLAWRAICFDTTQPERDRRAAQWALDHLNATVVGAIK